MNVQAGSIADIRRDKRTGIVLTVILMAFVVAYSLLYFNNTYPVSEGWGINYAELMAHGKVPYRDFYYYLPPLNLLIDAVFWKLSFGFLLAFRGWYLAQRVLIYGLLFHLLKKEFNQYTAFGACVLTSIIATGDVYDLIGDYNQTMTLLALLLTWCAINFVGAGSLKKKLAHMGAAGVVLGCMFLNKQTIFAACALVFFAVLTLLCIFERDKNYWWYCLATAGGMLIPVGIAFVYLGFNDALIPFFEQVFLNVEGKGSLAHILFYSVASRLWKPIFLGIIAIAIALVLIEKSGLKQMTPSICLLTGLLLAVYGACLYNEGSAMAQIIVRYRSAIVALLGCAVLAAGALWLSYRKDRRLNGVHAPQIDALTSMLCLVLACATCLYSENFAKDVYFTGKVFDLIQYAVSSLLFIGILLLIVLSLYKGASGVDTVVCARWKKLLFMSCGAFSLMYAGVMASGDSFSAAHVIRMALPLMLCLILDVRMDHAVVARLFKGSVTAVCIVLCVACVSQKITCSYSWWGSYMAPRSEKTYSVDIPAMAGIRVSADQKELYETVTHAIEDYTDEDAVVWGYPHIKIFNILTGRYNMNTFVPVLFYDVSADMYVEREAALLGENLPDAVVWEDIPGCIEAHETVFRGGEPLKQRQIVALFETLLPESYQEVARVGNVAVYIRRDVYMKHSGEA